MNEKLDLIQVPTRDAGQTVREQLRMLTVSLPTPLDMWLQAILTWMTGKPYRGQKPLFHQTPLTQFVTALFSLFDSVAVSWAIVAHSSPIYWLFLPISWLFTVGGARKMQVCIYHQAVHYNVSGNKIADRILGELISTILLIQDFESYRRDHMEDHHGKNFGTPKDPDVEFLLELGFRPGMTDEN